MMTCSETYQSQVLDVRGQVLRQILALSMMVSARTARASPERGHSVHHQLVRPTSQVVAGDIGLLVDYTPDTCKT